MVNNSPELWSQLTATLPAGVRVLETGANLGYTGGANTAILDWFETDTSAIVGSHDLHVAPSTLSTLVRAAETHPSFGIFGPVLHGKHSGTNSRSELAGTSGVVAEVESVSGTAMLLRQARPTQRATSGCCEASHALAPLVQCLRWS